MSMADPHAHAHAPRVETRLARAQDRVAAAFDIQPQDRTATIAAMIAKSRRQPASYWLQLMLAMGIATFGLVLSSTAVVIGAMLISPLMGPIVELGMGLAVGSPFLVLRSFARVAGSVSAVVCSAAAITLLLPFHEITAEIAARTAPTVLDLLVAVCCAVAAAYAVVRPGSDTTATAAGTAVGIALVPPLCVVGYGLGTKSAAVAGGASLLFTANLCAILLFAVLSFVVLGYGQVHVLQLEEEAFRLRDTPGVSLRAARFLGGVFSSTYGRLMRIVMPAILLISVYFPLRRALEEVSWEVGVRTKIQALLRELPAQSVQSSVTVERHDIDLRLVMVGKESEAARLAAHLRHEIEVVASVVPTVQVLAVPDAHELRAQMRQVQPAPPAAPANPDPAHLRSQVDQAVQRIWPLHESGQLVSTGISWEPEASQTQLEIVHLGAPIGAAAEQMLATSVSAELATPVSVRAHALPWAPSSAEPQDVLVWLSAAARTIGDLQQLPGVAICVESPATRLKSVPGAQEIVAALRASVGDAGPPLQVVPGPRWSLRVSTSTCRDESHDAGIDEAGDGSASPSDGSG